jgi:hypothetical protein
VRKLPAINIQYPISRLILSGDKTVETRTYPVPSELLGKELAIIETPGKTGNFPARIVGTIVFARCFPYANKRAFYEDGKRHFVTPASIWKWDSKKPKWGWEIEAVRVLKNPRPAPEKKGIIFTKEVMI